MGVGGPQIRKFCGRHVWKPPNVFARCSIDQSRSTFARSAPRPRSAAAATTRPLGWVAGSLVESGIRVVIIARSTTSQSRSDSDMMNSHKEMCGEEKNVCHVLSMVRSRSLSIHFRSTLVHRAELYFNFHILSASP